MTLLLVEDNLADVLLVRETIKFHNLPIEIQTAMDGEKAIHSLFDDATEHHPELPDLVLLDLNIPKLDGFEVLRRIRSSEHHASLPVIIVSSSDSPADLKVVERLADGYFRKPATYRDFLKLGEVLKRFLTDRQML